MSLQRMLHAGVGLPEAAFHAAGTATDEEEPAAGPSYSSSEEDAGEVPLGHALDLPSSSCNWRERFPLADNEAYPDCRGEVSVLSVHVEAVTMPSQPHSYYRIPAVHLASGAPVFLVAPITIPSTGIVFRDYPEITPEALTSWQPKGDR